MPTNHHVNGVVPHDHAAAACPKSERLQKPYSVAPRSRRQIAAAAMARVCAGPAFTSLGLTREQAAIAHDAYRLWAETWLVEDIRYLLQKDLRNAP